MIKQIDDLKLPASISGNSELINRDSTTQSVSGRLITNLDPNPKWQVTVNFDEFSLALEFQAAFYQKCLQMRTTPLPVTFVSPYDNQERMVLMRCISFDAPKILKVSRKNKAPSLYGEVGAVFQEI